MRIAVANSSAEWRGTETVALQLCRGLHERGHHVLLLCRPGSPLFDRLHDELPCEPLLGGSDANPRALGRVWTALRNHAIEVVVAQKDKDVRLTGPVAALGGRPLVIRHETDRPLKRRLRYRFWYGTLASHHIVNSEATRRTIRRTAPWIAADQITLIPNAIDTTPFDTATPADLAVPAGALRVGFLGRLEERKGVLDLAAAWPAIADAVPAAHLFIAGAGQLEDTLHDRLDGSPRVHWLGFHPDAAALLRALDVVVVPSHFEGFGLTAVEAMAAARPVVAAAASSLVEVVRHDETGLLVPPRDPPAIAAAVTALLLDASRRERLGAAARAHVQQTWTLLRMLEAHEALLARLAAEAQPFVAR